MKKAKEYAEEFLAEFSKYPKGSDIPIPELERLVDFTNRKILEMLDEISEIIKMRNAKFERALFPIYKEQVGKWKAICRLVNKPENEIMLNEEKMESTMKAHFRFNEVKFWYDHQ